jgi:hypothetical protein
MPGVPGCLVLRRAVGGLSGRLMRHPPGHRESGARATEHSRRERDRQNGPRDVAKRPPHSGAQRGRGDHRKRVNGREHQGSAEM